MEKGRRGGSILSYYPLDVYIGRTGDFGCMIHDIDRQAKRKEAIYRQMLEYRRMHAREQRRANDLEAQKRVLEASVQAVEICWTQVSYDALLYKGLR